MSKTRAHAVVASDNTFTVPARRIRPTRPADEYWSLWNRTGDPSAILAWGDALARDREQEKGGAS